MTSSVRNPWTYARRSAPVSPQPLDDTKLRTVMPILRTHACPRRRRGLGDPSCQGSSHQPSVIPGWHPNSPKPRPSCESGPHPLGERGFRPNVAPSIRITPATPGDVPDIRHLPEAVSDPHRYLRRTSTTARFHRFSAGARVLIVTADPFFFTGPRLWTQKVSSTDARTHPPSSDAPAASARPRYPSRSRRR